MKIFEKLMLEKRLDLNFMGDIHQLFNTVFSYNFLLIAVLTKLYFAISTILFILKWFIWSSQHHNSNNKERTSNTVKRLMRPGLMPL